jgi:hypothetical protein
MSYDLSRLPVLIVAFGRRDHRSTVDLEPESSINHSISMARWLWDKPTARCCLESGGGGIRTLDPPNDG